MMIERPKVTVVLREDLLAWQELNVAAFLTSGVVATHPELIGDPYVDADGAKYSAMLGHPVMVLVADGPTLTVMRQRAAARGMPVAIYTAELFMTNNDVDNRAQVEAVESDDLDLVGIGIAGERNAVDKVVKGGRLHP